jgi:nucleotide-binding universal stress UspA family protein
MYKRIVVTLDGSELAERVLPHALSLARCYGSTVELVRAYSPPASVLSASAATALPGTGPLVDPGPTIEAGERDADAYLDDVASQLAAEGIAVEHRRLDGPAGESIVAEARRIGADLIAMTTHGRSGLGRVVMGSVADEVVRTAPCPVLLVRAAEA